MRIQKILFPVDFSDRSRGATNFVEEFVGRFQAELTLLHVVPPFTYNDTMDKEADRRLQLESFLPADFKYFHVNRLLLHGDPALQIVDYARSSGSDLIMLSTHGYGPYRRFLLGSVTAKVLHDSDCPVWTASHLENAPPVEKISLHNILCAVDLDSQGLKTLQWGASLAAEFQAHLSLLHVVPEPEKDVRVRNAVAEMQRKAGTNATLHLEQGDIPDHVERAAKQLNADLVLIGRSSDAGVFGRLRKNSYAIIRQAPCAVISVSAACIGAKMLRLRTRSKAMKPVVGIFQSRFDAFRAVDGIRALGVTQEKVNILMPGSTDREVAAVAVSETEQPGMGAAIGSLVGGSVGAAGGFSAGAALASLLVPGVGPILAGGLLGMSLLGLGGAATGAAAGDALEDTISGIPRDELYVYEDALRKGRTIVIAETEDEPHAEAVRALAEAGAETIDAARDQWWIGLRTAEQETYTDGNFEEDEPYYRKGFETAQSPAVRGKTFDDALDYLTRHNQIAASHPAFKSGYERGRHFYEKLKTTV